MKKLLVVSLVIAIALVGATAAMAGISGTKHDLDSVATGITTELCAYCHTPHAGAAATTMSPLWNRNATTDPTTGFTFYGDTAAGTAAALTLRAKSAACMSCHDGATGINNIINVPGAGLGTSNNLLTIGSAGLPQANNASLIGTDLGNDHPVSIPYTVAHDLNTPLAGTSTDQIVRVTATGVTGADAEYVECVSCHDPHNNTVPLFLRVSNASSVLCLTCHNK
jgi:predicted CXXCH cytochrome family protein